MHPPVLVGKGCYGVWRVKVCYFNGRTHERDYTAFTASEAKRLYLREFGCVRQGVMSANLIKKF